MNTRERADRIGAQLDALYPETPVPLDHSDAFTLLVAVLLSAQCTDERVNLVTPALFARASTAAAMAEVPEADILEAIRSCGLAPTKARNIRALSQQLVRDHGGEVPADWEVLESLPGVGHKTASVVMSQAFGIPAFPVDTHIYRLARRWGLSVGSTVEKVEADLKAAFPEATWNKRHLQIIFFGRQYCPAQRHAPAACPICGWTGDHTPAEPPASPRKPRARS
jgi:endonuclease-3